MDTSIPALKHVISDVLRFREIEARKIQAVSQVLQRLAAKQITEQRAAKEIDRIEPGLGRKILGAIKRHGLVLVPLIIAGYGLVLQHQMLETAKTANEISRRSLEHTIEQAAEGAVSVEHKPSNPEVKDAGPSGAVKKNRRIRRAENAKKRKKK